MHVVIFRSTRTTEQQDLYSEWARKTEAAVTGVPGYVSHFGFWDPRTRRGVTVAYFESEEAITAWRDHPDHVRARDLGREHFYEDYTLEVACVERSYAWSRSSDN